MYASPSKQKISSRSNKADANSSRQKNNGGCAHTASTARASCRWLGNQAIGGIIQAKHQSGQQHVLGNDHSSDPFEREADRLASQVMRMADDRIGNTAQNSAGDRITAMASSPSGARLQTKTDSGPVPNLPTEAQLPFLKTPGTPLPDSERQFFEPRFGRDLGQVRIHNHPQAQRQARALHARAFTIGSDVAFAPGQYAPGHHAGRQLLAHELVHTLQQSAPGPASRLPLSRVTPRIQRVGFGETLARFFGGGTFGDDELQAYLRFLDTENRIEDNYDSDNKARAVVDHWRQGDSLYILPLNRKILLIREMMSGYTGGDDEDAILSLLSGATPDEFSRILSNIGQDTLRDEIQGRQRREYDALVAQRAASRSADQALASRSTAEVFSEENILELQRRFTANARLANNVRRNCILIIRELAPQLFSADPQVAQSVQTALGRLRGPSLKMTELGRVLSQLGLVSNSAQIRFNNGNGNNEPTEMLQDPWNTIMAMVGNVPGWHVFGLAPFQGYHSVTVLVNNRPDGPRLYWADQWRIDPGDNFDQAPGSASGFRRYEQAGFNSFLLNYTRSRWNSVHSENSDCGQEATRRGRNWDQACRWSTTLHIWKFRSQLAPHP